MPLDAVALLSLPWAVTLVEAPISQDRPRSQGFIRKVVWVAHDSMGAGVPGACHVCRLLLSVGCCPVVRRMGRFVKRESLNLRYGQRSCAVSIKITRLHSLFRPIPVAAADHG